MNPTVFQQAAGETAKEIEVNSTLDFVLFLFPNMFPFSSAMNSHSVESLPLRTSS